VAAEFEEHPFVHEILDFIREGKDRSICTPKDPVSSGG
jgi:UDP-N-acetylglucosamine acyltransferase